MTLKCLIILLMAMTMAITDPIKYYELNLKTIDIEKVFKMKDSLRMYTDCFLDKGPCDEIGGKIRKVIPDSVMTACAKCTPHQKHATRRYFEELTRQFPDDVPAMTQKYDPELKYFFNFMSAVKDA